MIPLLPFLLICHSSCRWKLSYSSSVTISQSPLILSCFFTSVSRQREPSFTFHTESILPPPYLCQPFVFFPLNNNVQPSFLSSLLRLLTDGLEGPQALKNRVIISTGISCR